MYRTFRNNKAYWTVPLEDHEQVFDRVESLLNGGILHPNEPAFISGLLANARGRRFTLSDPQATWLDAILIRNTLPPLFPQI
ncbi:hypothetical protein KCP91_12015 [Microvirga sp. SRT01]|uniref:Uncharacterized protein n=1 Tax=Sphingomonas longa TaxID=2778730 RepID=A0ABS2D990_9SPHN|nr:MULTISPECIES: hypothetical protein [Alphaproteobacteria]MBM6577098.1 hypothetical protein [Sphingomonas sp. BT552]MBR7710142.1 hypothetical protein [Microvirga sp. SRT01]